MPENEDQPQQPGFVSNLLTTKNVVLIVIGILTAWNTYTTQVTKNKLDITKAQLDTAKARLEIQSIMLENQSTALESDLRKREFGNSLKFRLYEEVRNAITGREPKIQDAVVLIINEMLADDSVYRAKLSNILLSSQNTDAAVKTSIVQTQKLEYTFVAEQTQTLATLNRPENEDKFTIDVFYLEDVKQEAKPRAEKIVTLLDTKYPQHTVRLRMLPKIINARSGYGIGSNQVRYEPGEKKLAEEVIDYITSEKIFPREQLTGHPVKSKTTHYISVFVRNM